jgi:hypothetical protein
MKPGDTFSPGREASRGLLGPLLPHEVAFGVFLVVTWLRFVLKLGFTSVDALFYLALIAGNIAIIGAAQARPVPFCWRLRLLFYPVAMNLVFPHMKAAIPRIALEGFDADAVLNSIDEALFGLTPALSLRALAAPVLTEFLSLCYLLFFVYLLFSLIYYLVGPLELAKKFITGLFVIYGVGFLGYTWMPASGPWVAMAHSFPGPLEGGWITKANDAIVRMGSNGVDVFPSLHCAVSSYFLFFDRRHRPWRYRLYLVPCVGLWFSTLYLRYHYAIDVICGFALSALALWLVNRSTASPKPMKVEGTVAAD